MRTKRVDHLMLIFARVLGELENNNIAPRTSRLPLKYQPSAFLDTRKGMICATPSLVIWIDVITILVSFSHARLSRSRTTN